MENVQIRILPEADDFLTSLADVLVREGYKPNFVRAAQVTDDILNFITHLAKVPHYRLAPYTAYHFSKYGADLWYAFFKRKSSPRTTWYIFFEKQDNCILVKHISNNWIDGQYIR